MRSHGPAGRVSVYLQRVGHAALDGAGAVQAGHTGGVNAAHPGDGGRFLAIMLVSI